MTAVFTDPLRFQDPGQPDDAARLLALLGDDAEMLSLLHKRLCALQNACVIEGQCSWGVSFFLLGEDYAVFLRAERQLGCAWSNELCLADISACHQQALELPMESVLCQQDMFARWAGEDDRFLKAFHSAALLTCMDGESRFVCRVAQNQRALAEAVLADILCLTLPQQHLRFVTAVAGTGGVAELGCRYTVAAGGNAFAPEADFRGASADFLPQPPVLNMRFGTLGFAQRTIRTLLKRLDLPLLVSMWNAAERVTVETIGARDTARAQDIVTWQMLRKNFGNHKFPITEAEHAALQRRVREFHRAEEE